MKLRRVVQRSLFLAVLIWIGCLSSIQAQTSSFTYQGNLTDTTNLSGNGTYAIQFAIYDDPTASAPVNCNGNATTDANGEATIVLPEYFESLNRDFRYQLTVIGQFAQAIVSEEIKGNSFRIKTDKPNVKVSWQVTGIRKDKFAEENRIPNVEEKPKDERGKCLYAPACSERKPDF